MSTSREVFEGYIRSISGFKSDFQVDCNGAYKSDLMNVMLLTWQEQQKRIDELRAKFEDALFDMNQRKLELCESCDGYKDPVGVCQSEGLEMAINILKQALKGGEV